MRTPMREHETSAPSLGELSEAATPGVVTVHEGQPCNHGEDGGGGFTLCFGGLRRTGSGPVVHRFGYAEDIWEDHFPAAFAEAKANIGLLARLWNDYRAGRLIDPTAMAEAVASARAEERDRCIAIMEKYANACAAAVETDREQRGDAEIAMALHTIIATLIPGDSSDV